MNEEYKKKGSVSYYLGMVYKQRERESVNIQQMQAQIINEVTILHLQQSKFTNIMLLC